MWAGRNSRQPLKKQAADGMDSAVAVAKNQFIRHMIQKGCKKPEKRGFMLKFPSIFAIRNKENHDRRNYPQRP